MKIIGYRRMIQLNVNESSWIVLKLRVIVQKSQIEGYKGYTCDTSE